VKYPAKKYRKYWPYSGMPMVKAGPACIKRPLTPSAFPSDLLEKMLAMPYCRVTPSLRADLPVEVIAITLLSSTGGFFPSLDSTLILKFRHILTHPV
jgi:hypothetical protein